MASIPCPSGCGECCGMVQFSKAFWLKHKDRAQAPIKEYMEHGDQVLVVTDNGIECIFLDKDKRCSVYDNRPDVCKEYGDAGLECPYFDECGNKRSRQDRRRTQRLIAKRVDATMLEMTKLVQSNPEFI